LKLFWEISILIVSVAFLFLIFNIPILIYNFFKKRNMEKLKKNIVLIQLSFLIIIYLGLYFIGIFYYQYFFLDYEKEVFTLLGLIIFYYGIFFIFNILYYLIIWNSISNKIILFTLIPYLICLITLFFFKQEIPY
jgi:hypothetical protein